MKWLFKRENMNGWNLSGTGNLIRRFHKKNA